MDNRELVHHEIDGAAFDLPARWTVREMMRYESAAILDRAGASTYERLWAGVQIVAQNWRAPFELRADLDGLTDAKAFDAIKWACMICWAAYQNAQADELPKNL